MITLSWKSEWLPPARRFAGLEAASDRDGPVSYGALFDDAAGVAAVLLDLGVGPGDVVASCARNSRHAIAASYGIALTGAAEAPINPALSPDDMRHCLELAGARRIVTTREGRAAVAGLPVETLLADEMPPAALAGLPEARVDPDSWGRVMFTSGTTSRPKGIVHSHGGRWTANLLLRASLPIAPAPGRKVLLMTPYAHGTSLMTQAFLDGGAAVLLVDGIREDVIVRAVTERQVDQIFAPPTVLARLVALLEGRRIEGIEAIFCGTSPLPRELYQEAKAIFGPVVRVTYGKTEVVNPITVLTPAETDRWYAREESADSICVGWPASGVEVVIGPDEGEDDGPPRDDPRVGPVLLRARHMLIATLSGAGVEPLAPDALHRTGDLGFLDAEGRLHLVGREADVIKTGGYRVTPDEIEGRLRPGLERGELVVVGLPSAYWGEIITVAAAGAAPDWQERLQTLVAGMTGYKRPRLFAELPEIARNALGKVVRRRVRDAVLDAYRLRDGRYPTLERRQAGDSGS